MKANAGKGLVSADGSRFSRQGKIGNNKRAHYRDNPAKRRKNVNNEKEEDLASWDEGHKMFSAHTATTDDFRVATHDNAKEERNRPEGTKLTWVLVTVQDPSPYPSPSHRGPNAPLNAALAIRCTSMERLLWACYAGKEKTRNKNVCRVEKSETGSGTKRHRFKCPTTAIPQRTRQSFLSPIANYAGLSARLCSRKLFANLVFTR